VGEETGSEQKVQTSRAYRGLKRLTSVATFLLFAASLIVGYLCLSATNDIWPIAMWSAIGASVVATLFILGFIGAGWSLPAMGGSRQFGRIAAPTAIWLLLGIEFPWILAWLAADIMGNWWQAGHSDGTTTPYLWAVRLTSWIAAYALASALGVLATILVDIRVNERTSAKQK
jgi:hypothetical protein